MNIWHCHVLPVYHSNYLCNMNPRLVSWRIRVSHAYLLSTHENFRHYLQPLRSKGSKRKKNESRLPANTDLLGYVVDCCRLSCGHGGQAEPSLSASASFYVSRHKPHCDQIQHRRITPDFLQIFKGEIRCPGGHTRPS